MSIVRIIYLHMNMCIMIKNRKGLEKKWKNCLDLG